MSRNRHKCSKCFNPTWLHYRLSSSCKTRAGLLLYGRVSYITKKVQNVANNASRHVVRSNYWCSIALHPDEISQTPPDIIASLVRENQTLTKELEGKNNKRLMQSLKMHLLNYGTKLLTFHGRRIKHDTLLKNHIVDQTNVYTYLLWPICMYDDQYKLQYTLITLF